MYQSHFHLQDRPFSSAANPEHYFPAGSIEQARESIARNVERSSCVTIVTGPVGSGKTLLCQLIANQFAGELPVCLVRGESLHSPEVLLQSILHKLGLPFRGQDGGELRLILADHISSPGCIKGILLIIDDADRLNTELLDEVRSITNIVKEGQPCARILLAGSPRLDENIAHPELESLNQRIVGRLYLDNFSYQETGDYVQARIAACGGDGHGLFTPDALETIHRATNGVPRLVNQICDHALMLGSINNADQLTARLIEEAWADLQQLPVPTASLEHEVEFEAGEDSVIEFGLLDESSEANELVEIEQTLADLGYEASRAARPIAVGREIEFESGHHEIKSAHSSSLIPEPSDATEEESSGGADVQDANDSADDAFPTEPTQTLYFESPGEEPQATITFEAEVNEEDSNAQSVTESTATEFVFDIHDDFDDTEPDNVLSEYNLPTEPEVSDSSVTDDAELEAIFEIGADGFDETGDHGLRVHGGDDDDANDQVDSSGGEEEGAEALLSEPPHSGACEGGTHDASNSAADLHDHGASLDDQKSAPDQASATIDQVDNPFGHGFTDEEVVIQQFTSPSRLARGSYDPVSTAYSQQLALQLIAAHPGLRMHPAIESIEIEDVADSSDFQPLSACIDSDAFAYEDDEQQTYSPADDPVMPESSLRDIPPGVVTEEAQFDPQLEDAGDSEPCEVDASADADFTPELSLFADTDQTTQAESATDACEQEHPVECDLLADSETEAETETEADLEETIEAESETRIDVRTEHVSDDAVVATIGVQAVTNVVTKRKKRFRTLFSSMRSRTKHST